MINVLLIVYSLFFLDAYADLISGEVNYADYETAKKSKPFLKFTVKSTKVRLITSDVDGYVKNFKYSFDYNRQYKIIRNMKLAFFVKSMDTDIQSRDKKLHNYCLSHKKYPIITIEVRGPIFLNQMKEKNYPAQVSIRGKDKKVLVKLKNTFKNNMMIMTGKSLWTFSKMEIPDPSIMIAKLSDEIRIELDIRKKL